MKSYYNKTWKIGELARIFNVNVQLLRHYDKAGLLVPDIRNPENKWRTYRYDQIYSLGMMTDLFELPGIALLVVSDNSALGAALVGRTEEQQKQYDYGRNTVLPDMILTLAAE